MTICGVIPPHMLTRIGAGATLEHMRELATDRAATLLERPVAVAPEPARSRKCRNVYDAQHTFRLPGKLRMSEHKPRNPDLEVTEAWEGSGATYDFFAQFFIAPRSTAEACRSTPPCTTASPSKMRSGTAAR